MTPTWMRDPTWTPYTRDGRMPARWASVPCLACHYDYDLTRRILGLRKNSKLRQELYDYWSWFAAARHVRGEI